MGWTKRQFVSKAFSKIGFASYTYDLNPEQLQGALADLDSMIATWQEKNIELGYPFATDPDNADLDTLTNVPLEANEAIYTNLAIRLAPDVGKMIPPEINRAAKAAYQVLLSKAAMPDEMQLTDLPSGAGNKSWRIGGDPFLEQRSTDPIQNGDNGQLEFKG